MSSIVDMKHRETNAPNENAKSINSGIHMQNYTLYTVCIKKNCKIIHYILYVYTKQLRNLLSLAMAFFYVFLSEKIVDPLQICLGLLQNTV